MCLFYFIDCCNNIYQNFSLEKLLKQNKTKQNPGFYNQSYGWYH